MEIRRGPNIVPLPQFPKLADEAAGEVLLKVGDNITTDHILPAGAKIMPYRSNIPAISKFCFTAIDETFHDRAKAAGGGFVIGGLNYGQGSSREHAAMCPQYLGIKAILAKSYARIHRNNLINMGIIPILFKDAGDYENIAQGDRIEMKNLYRGVDEEKLDIQVIRKDGSRKTITVLLPLQNQGKGNPEGWRCPQLRKPQIRNVMLSGRCVMTSLPRLLGIYGVRRANRLFHSQRAPVSALPTVFRYAARTPGAGWSGFLARFFRRRASSSSGMSSSSRPSGQSIRI